MEPGLSSRFRTRPPGPLKCAIVANRVREAGFSTYCAQRVKGAVVTAFALVAASDFNAKHFRALDVRGAFDKVVAVDGGFAHLEALGRMPDVALGDFDSLGYEPVGVEVRRFPSHKDKSDLEIAFDYAMEKQAESLIVYGALGGRLDHTMANLQMGARFAEEGLGVMFVGQDCAVSIVVGPARFELPALQEGTVSVFSARDCAYDVAESGMEYPLDAEVLTNRTTLGVSNELMGKPASVSVREGTLYVFHPLEP